MMSSYFSRESFLFWQVEKRILLDIKKDEHVASLQLFVGLTVMYREGIVRGPWGPHMYIPKPCLILCALVKILSSPPAPLSPQAQAVKRLRIK
jgi:hypothetical protein